MTAYKRILLALLAACTLASCGGGGSSSSSSNDDSGGVSPDAPSLSMAVAANKTFEFSWKDVAGETEYRLLESADGSDDFTPIASIAANSVSHAIQVPLYKRVNARYKLQSCNAAGCRNSEAIGVSGALNMAIGYIKASNTGKNDNFGNAIALSSDGNTLAVGAYGEASNAAGINGNQADDSIDSSGAVYIFTRSGSTWNQQAYVKASNPGEEDYFGSSVALSADGNTLAVGAFGEASNATGINGNQANNSADNSGAVYIFTRSGSSWNQQAYVKASNTGSDDHFGFSVALSADGSTMTVGASWEDSNAIGIDGDQADNSGTNSGAVYVFIRSGSTWSQQAYVKASNTGQYDNFGNAIALSADGNTMAVAAFGEDSNAAGINGSQADNSKSDSGAVYIFARSGGIWSQQAYAKASNSGLDDQFGNSLALSADGNTLAVAAHIEDSSATGINGNQTNNSSIDSGAVYVFTRDGSTWNQQAYVKTSNPGEEDYFGSSVALSADGNTLAVGAFGENSNATGINGNQANNSTDNSGAVYIFSRNGSTWSQQAYVKASNSASFDSFGYSVALSADGNLLAVGAYNESSNATGINGNQADNTANSAGAVYIY